MKFLLFLKQNTIVDIFLQNSVELCHFLQWRFCEIWDSRGL